MNHQVDLKIIFAIPGPVVNYFFAALLSCFHSVSYQIKVLKYGIKLRLNNFLPECSDQGFERIVLV